MAKKRKAGGRPSGGPKPLDDKDAKLTINTFEDVADSEDEFHMNRDKVLLDEGPAAKRLRKWKEQEDFLQPSDEEVLGYENVSEEEEEEEEDYEEDDDMEDDGDMRIDQGPSKRKQADEDEDEDLAAWGSSKKDYYNADAIETEQDALDEEAEARRIQQKQLQAMTEADFGFDEEEWLDTKEGEKGAAGKVVTETLPQLQITEDMTEDEKLKILHSRYPEFEPIRKEFLRLQLLHVELKGAAEAAERFAKGRAARSGKSTGALRPKPTAVLKYWACASYLGAMCMYFAMLTSTAKEDGSAALAIDPTELHEHPVMETVLKCQKVWRRVESLPVADPMVDASNGDELSVIEEASPVPNERAKADEPIATKRKEKKEKTKSKIEAAARAEAEARRAEKLRKTEEELASLATLTDKSVLKSVLKKKAAQKPMLNLLNADDSDFGEETALTAHELAEKAKKKKSLRFHTSQITQKASKRGAAGREQGGDADIPHRERLKDRQARLQAEAEKRGQNKDKGPGALLGEGGESSDDDAGQRDGAGSEDDDYYDMVVQRNKAKKQDKAEKAAAYALAAKENGTVVPQETIGEDGRRIITYAIEKNKGLTPHRKKEVRNPRVKKKMKYEAAKKKLKSQKAVYKPEGRGGYQGELTGIKTGIVKSVKL